MKIFDPKLIGSIQVQSAITGSVTISGSLTITGSLNVSEQIYSTSSWAQNSVTASIVTDQNFAIAYAVAL